MVRARPSCARATRSSPSAAPTIASRAATTAPASSRSIPATSRRGPSSSPNRPIRRRCSRCNRACRCCRPRPPPAGPARRRRPSAKPQLMRRLRRTKIVATLGPASSDRSVIASLFRAGADVFRINMSHTTHERMRELVATIRAVEAEHGRPIGILVDLQGPKLRVGSFAAGPATLVPGETFVLDADPAPGDASRVHLPHPEIFAAIEPGHTPAARRRQGAAHRHRGRQGPHRHARRGRRQAVGPQGREPAGHHDSVLGAGAEGPLRSRGRARRRHRLGGALLHPAAGRHRRGQEDHARPRRRDGEDREAAGGDTGSTRSSISPTR